MTSFDGIILVSGEDINLPCKSERLNVDYANVSYPLVEEGLVE